MTVAKTEISWCDSTWNILRGCSRVSAGCQSCYAEQQAGRFSGSGQPYEGLVRKTSQGFRWTGAVRFIEHDLEVPLRWKKPRRIFVNSMSDLFHEAVPEEQIDRIFAVMALAPQHTFQILTKRAERLHAYFTQQRILSSVPEDVAQAAAYGRVIWDGRGSNPDNYRMCMGGIPKKEALARRRAWPGWPLPNVWVGVSCENQATADVRIPWLMKTPATVRFVSYEPALGPVDFRLDACGVPHGKWGEALGACGYYCDEAVGHVDHRSRLDWLIVGGESGPKARPCELDWLRNAVAQCQAAQVAVWVKQLGSQPRGWSGLRNVTDRKGANPDEWPAALCVQQFPGGAA